MLPSRHREGGEGRLQRRLYCFHVFSPVVPDCVHMRVQAGNSDAKSGDAVYYPLVSGHQLRPSMARTLKRAVWTHALVLLCCSGECSEREVCGCSKRESPSERVTVMQWLGSDAIDNTVARVVDGGQ
jgi:hypothetical protein